MGLNKSYFLLLARCKPNTTTIQAHVLLFRILWGYLDSLDVLHVSDILYGVFIHELALQLKSRKSCLIFLKWALF